LDELNEFRRDAIEGLRQPLEDGRVVVTRAVGAVEFPARFTLVAAANPCPCGFNGDARRRCDCLDHRKLAYRQKLSGPLLDRMDIRLNVPRLSPADLMDESPGECSDIVRGRVEEARDMQRRRWSDLGYRCNSDPPGPLIRKVCRLSDDAQELLGRAAEALSLTGRGFDRALKVARTVADLQRSDRVTSGHLAEALSYRSSDKETVRAG
jgi:magnesium chelatase family protein